MEPFLVLRVFIIDEPALLCDHPRSHEIVVLVKLAEPPHHTFRALAEDLAPHRDTDCAWVDEHWQMTPSRVFSVQFLFCECSYAVFFSPTSPQEAILESDFHIEQPPVFVILCYCFLIVIIEFRLALDVANCSLLRPAQRGHFCSCRRQRGRQAGQDTVQRLRVEFRLVETRLALIRRARLGHRMKRAKVFF